jgi:hypothetical protein
MLPRQSDPFPSVPPEKWLIKAYPNRKRYETVKLSAFKKSFPSFARDLQTTTSAASVNDKLTSASFNVKVNNQPHIPNPILEPYCDIFISHSLTQPHRLMPTPLLFPRLAPFQGLHCADCASNLERALFETVPTPHFASIDSIFCLILLSLFDILSLLRGQ